MSESQVLKLSHFARTTQPLVAPRVPKTGARASP
jgi:hypothetical protein